ncbi:MAG: hypothetical protein J2O46_03310 [Nocardioides sp.]|nr:hypothetical protein [Nocardioides sp.]
MSTPETVHAVVLNVEDAPIEDEDAAEEHLERSSRAAGIVGLAKLAWRVSGFIRRPFLAPLALAAPILKGVVTETGPVVVLRAEGRDISPREWAAMRGRAKATSAEPRLLVLVPPAGRDETVWVDGVDHTGATYADRLTDLLGWTPIHAKVAASAKSVPAAVALSSLLQECVDAVPGDLRIVLVGYAGGGLVARNALGVAAPGARPWTTYVTELIALGTAPYGVTSTPISGEVGKQLDEQLAGIAVVGQDEAMLPPRPNVDYLLVTDDTTARPNRIGRLVGEVLWWRRKSPLGSRRVRDLFPTAERFTLSTAETPLSNHPAVHDALLRWLA